MIVVTGATGHIGNNLVRLLLEKGEQVRVLVLPKESIEPIQNLDVEIFEGDIREPESLDRAFQDATLVYHLASFISLIPGNTALLEWVNVKGARNVAESCLRMGVKRLVYTSSIHALVELPHGNCIDESVGFDPERITMEYSKTKARGTLEVMDVINQGLDAVILFPAGVIGPHDYRPSDVGQMMVEFSQGKIPASIDGGYNFVDVRDVAQGHILAAEKGKAGEGYILSGDWISVTDILTVVSELTGQPLPRVTLPASLVLKAAQFLTWFSRLTGKKPMVTVDMIETLLSNSEISCNKARVELGFSSRPIRESIRDSVLWMKQKGMI